MEDRQELGAVNINTQNTNIPIQLGYTYNENILRIWINYKDLIRSLLQTYPNNLQNVTILFTINVELKNGAQHEVRFIIQETTMNASMNIIERKND